MRKIRLALAQINPTVGELKGNLQKILKYLKMAHDQGADIIAFPELVITGYPPEDLLLKPGFIEENLDCLQQLVPHSKDIVIVVGYVDRGDDIFNGAAVLCNQKIAGVYHKRYLPNYGVFDEDRYFQAGKELSVFHFNGFNFGVNICEDLWYPGGPLRDQALYGNAEVVIDISASPYVIGKGKDREKMISVRARDNDVIVAYVNLVGGQDELVFDGTSLVVNQEGEVLGRSPSFQEHLLLVDLHPDNVFNRRLHDPRRRKEKFFTPPAGEIVNIFLSEIPLKKNRNDLEPHISAELSPIEEIYQALNLGLKDYVTKNRFQKVVLGLSGGIDSALVAAIAVDALGSANVIGISMPSEFTSADSLEDARQLAKNLKIEYREIAISRMMDAYLQELEPHFKGHARDITEENLQARIRGNILMALSNKFGWLVLSTGNKSEVSVGYCTLYGDMVGGFSVIKDVPKLLVYELSRYRNQRAGKSLIPERILEKPPSAELRPDQKDTDTLPPYEILDPILRAYVEKDLSYEEIVSQGFAPAVVKQVIHLVDGNEYKRRQAAPGIKITHRAFGKDRRFPITNRFNPKK